ncbi:BglG family transcription antiterminator [Vagococcus fluvialis]|uniref:BglG family transcription antiterminator n=1 Tax=Vagococcus fluvialis TaxID=2738 RepID=UPI0037CD587D
MTHLSVSIMEAIVKQPGISLLGLEKKFKIKSRQLEYQLKKINSILYEESQEPLFRQNKRVWLNIDEMTLKNVIIKIREEQISSKKITKEDRKLFIAILIAKENNVTLNKLANNLLVSKNTIQNDINALKKTICRYNISLKNSKRKGYYIYGTEIEIRKFLITIIQKLLNNSYNIHEVIGIINLDTDKYYLFEDQLEDFEKKLKIRFSDNQFFSLTLFAYLIDVRIKMNHKIQLKYIYLDSEADFNYLANILSQYSLLSFSDYEERIYFSIQIYSANVISSTLIKDINIGPLISQMINYVEKQLIIRFTNKNELQTNLTNHLMPAIYRHKYGTPYEDERINSFDKDYYSLLPIILESIKIVEDTYQITFTETEIFYVGLIFKNFISREENESRDREVQAIVLCENGLSVSSLLFETLTKLFPNIHFVNYLSIREFSEKAIIYKNVDIVFSTSFVETEKVLFIVNPLMKESEKIELLTIVNQRYFGRNDVVDIGGLIKIIKKNADIKNVNNLEEEIYRHFYKETPKIVNASNFNSLLTLDKIKTTKRKFTFEEAIWAVAEPLLKENYIETSYVEKIINNYDENYPYFVIAPGVAMPHADFKSGVNKLGFSLLKVETLVHFSNELYVNLILMVTPIDNQSHRSAIHSFYELVSNKIHREKLLAITEKKELKKYLELYIK